MRSSERSTTRLDTVLQLFWKGFPGSNCRVYICFPRGPSPFQDSPESALEVLLQAGTQHPAISFSFSFICIPFLCTPQIHFSFHVFQRRRSSASEEKEALEASSYVDYPRESSTGSATRKGGLLMSTVNALCCLVDCDF